MDKKDLLFYDAYEAFYKMAKESQAFRAFCRDAFGEDLSQDGFGNMEQIEMLLPYIPENARILDIGCGNGKLLGYLQRKTHSRIYGFDYSEEAISTARRLYPDNSEFRVGIIGETDYPDELFDLLMAQTECALVPYAEFREKMSRYIYVIRKRIVV